MTEKDYSLLRPFDLEAAKAGAGLTNGTTVFDCKPVWKYVAGPDSAGFIAVEIVENGRLASPAPTSCFRLAPLYWVEGRPVYPGDVLWQTTPAGDVLKRKAKQISADGSYLEFEETGSWAMDGSVSKLSWVEPPPKPVKYWINIYECSCFASKAAADRDAGHTRLDCIEIELPPLKP